MAPPPRLEAGAVVRLELLALDGVAAPLRADGEPPDRLAAGRLAVGCQRGPGGVGVSAPGGGAGAARAAGGTGYGRATAPLA